MEKLDSGKGNSIKAANADLDLPRFIRRIVAELAQVAR